MTIALISIFSITSCRAQVSPLYKADPDLPEGTYFKDMDNDLDKFVGTWKWQNGNDEFIVVLEKKEHILDVDGEYYNDLLIGEYSYIENGVELANYLPNLNDSSILVEEHNLTLLSILHKNHHPICEECDITERRVTLLLHDPERDWVPARITLRHVMENGVEKLEAFVHGGGAVVQPNENAPTWIRVPMGNYVMVKQ